MVSVYSTLNYSVIFMRYSAIPATENMSCFKVGIQFPTSYHQSFTQKITVKHIYSSIMSIYIIRLGVRSYQLRPAPQTFTMAEQLVQ